MSAPGGERADAAARTLLDRHHLYELAVQSPPDVVPLLRALHGRSPTVLGEDFAGTAAIARTWVVSVPQGSAVAVERDAELCSRAAGWPRLRTICADVRDADLLAPHAADVIHAGNFSLGYLQERTELVRYLSAARARLRPNGLFACDTYGGPASLRTGAFVRDRHLPDGTRVRTTWEQREVDPLAMLVTDALHFRVDRGGDVLLEIPDAFIYRWRLWSVPELRDALAEAGFARSAFTTELPQPGEAGEPRLDPPEAQAGEWFAVCVAAWAD